MNLDSLREQIARAIYNQRPELQPWDGDRFEFHETGARYGREVAYKQADAVIKVLKEVG